jgi:putative transposase
MIQNVSLIEETIQRGVESGGFAGKIGEQAYLNEALSTLDFRGEAVLGRKKVTQWVSVSVGVLPLVCVSRGVFVEGYKQSAFGSFPYVAPFVDWGRSAAEMDLGEDGIRGMERFLEQRGFMAYDPQRHHRRSIRLKGYDYTQPGAYFITICTHGRECLFGEIIDGEMHLNEAGQIVVQTWQDLPNHVPNVQLDAFVVMPNHVHGIIIITDRTGGIGAGFKPARTTMGPGSAADSGSTPGPDSAVGAGSTAGPGSVGAGSVGAGSEPAPTKTTTTAPGSAAGSGPVGAGSEPAPTEPAPTRSSYGLPEIVRQFKTFSARRINELRGTPGTPVWQRNYYEHIIRNESSLNRIRQYIAENLARWDADQENPQRPHHARRHSLPPSASQRENPTPPPPKGTPRS